MYRKHVNILTRLCAPHAFLLVERRSNGAYCVKLVEDWQPSKLSICRETLEKWVSLDYITRSAHLSESYIVTVVGRSFVARFEEADIPLTYTSILAAQRLARAALGR